MCTSQEVTQGGVWLNSNSFMNINDRLVLIVEFIRSLDARLALKNEKENDSHSAVKEGRELVR